MSDANPVWMRGASPLKGTLLALLVQRPGHGYDLGNRLHRRLGEMWHMELEKRNLYRKLEQLEKGGLVRSERQPRKDPSQDPGRRLYTALPNAEDAVAEWMAAPAHLEPRRPALQAKIAGAQRKHVPLLLEGIEKYEQECFERLSAIQGGALSLDSLLGISIFLARESELKHLEAELAWTDTARRAFAAFLAANA